jgi:hypothetical protein
LLDGGRLVMTGTGAELVAAYKRVVEGD